MKNFILISSLTLYSISIFGQEIFTKDDAAIRGYDPVAYFSESKPVKGDDRYTFEWNHALWKFSSEMNRNQFIADPEKFAPQFGGFCAYGMGDESGHKAPTSPDAWTIVNGKLYLNYNTDVKALWNKKQDEFISNAHKNWPRVKTERD
jgi:hypothetical protein